MTQRSWWAAHALIDGRVRRDVRFEAAAGRFTAVIPDVPAGEAPRLPGVVLPGFANGHSHAFHRALRGRTHDGGGTFWAWRERMYAVAARLDPDTYYALARATYAELVLGGVTAVAEFHYLHHGPGGTRYRDPNAMAAALRVAAADAGIRLTLLDACYLTSGPVDDLSVARAAGDPATVLDPVQQRFSDGDAVGWAQRFAALIDGSASVDGAALIDGAAAVAGEPAPFRVGAAVHSVRAVPRTALPIVVDAAAGRPLHVHLSEQQAENAACVATHGVTPTRLLAQAGALGPRTTAVHATHLTAADVALIGRSGTAVCLCPLTERDLADGIGPAAGFAAAGVPIALGTDQHVVGDLLAEAQGMEGHERLRSGQRGGFDPADLLAALTRHDVLGDPLGGRLVVGAPADLVAVRTDTVRTAGSDPAQIVLTASAADVDTVVVGGREVVRGGAHLLGDIGALLAAAITPLWAPS